MPQVYAVTFSKATPRGSWRVASHDQIMSSVLLVCPPYVEGLSLFALHTRTQDPRRILTACHLWRTLSIYTSALNTCTELLQPGRHRLIRLLSALLALAPDALVLADARPPALLAFDPLALVLADARPPALLALAPSVLVLADARPPALLALAPDALVLADARPPALLALAPLALVLADARPPALLALAPDALVLADARPHALLASAPSALVLADARPPAILASAPLALLADARPPALLALAPSALVLADARPPALLALAPDALVRADAQPSALLAFAPLALVRADTGRLLLRGAPRRVGLSAHPPLAGTAASWICRRGALLTGALRRSFAMRIRARVQLPKAVCVGGSWTVAYDNTKSCKVSNFETVWQRRRTLDRRQPWRAGYTSSRPCAEHSPQVCCAPPRLVEKQHSSCRSSCVVFNKRMRCHALVSAFSPAPPPAP
jgi:hypothetical protein